MIRATCYVLPMINTEHNIKHKETFNKRRVVFLIKNMSWKKKRPVLNS